MIKQIIRTHERKRRTYPLLICSSRSSLGLGTPLLVSFPAGRQPPASIRRFFDLGFGACYRSLLLLLLLVCCLLYPPTDRPRHFLQESRLLREYGHAPKISPKPPAHAHKSAIGKCRMPHAASASRQFDHEGHGHSNRITMPPLGPRPYPRVAILLHGHLHGKRSQKTAHDSGRR